MPVTETLFYYTEDDFKIPSIDERKMLVFMHSCDVNGLHRIDNVYLKNGSEPDFYYKRLSFGTNKTEDYSLGVKGIKVMFIWI